MYKCRETFSVVINLRPCLIGFIFFTMNIHDIFDICTDDVNLLAFLLYYNLILTDKQCDNCLQQCEIFKRADKFIFRCTTKNCCTKFSVSPKRCSTNPLESRFEAFCQAISTHFP